MYNSDRCTCRAKFPFFFGNPVRTKTIDLSKSINHRAIDFGSMSVLILRRNTMYSSPSGSTGGCRVLHPIYTAGAESYTRYIRRLSSPTPGTYGGCRVLHPVHTATAESYTRYIRRMPSPTPNTKSCIAYPNDVWLQLVHTLSRDLFMHYLF